MRRLRPPPGEPDRVEQQVDVDGLVDHGVRARGQALGVHRVAELGDAARVRLRTGFFEWESKADRMLEIYRETIVRSKTRTG